MRRLLSFAVAAMLLAPSTPLNAQSDTWHSSRSDEEGWVGGTGSANWQLAARWAPYNVGDMLYDMTVSPQFIRGSDKFWYEWETSDGSFWYMVDPDQRTKRLIFDRDALAAELTRITRDPWDGQNLPIRGIDFVDDNTLRFEVEGSQQVEVEADVDEDDMEEGEEAETEMEDEMFYFEWTISTQTLRQLDGPEEPTNHPNWANVSPDGQTIVFAQNHNLYMIDADQYQEVLDARQGKTGSDANDAAEEIELDSIPLTTDGEPYFTFSSGASGNGINDVDKEERWGNKSRPGLSWSSDSRRFTVSRADNREVDFLMVVHNTGTRRPEVESYKYVMPGEDDAGITHLTMYDLDDMEMREVATADHAQGPNLSVINKQVYRYPQDEGPFQSQWASDDPNEIMYMSTSRDLHRVDLIRHNLATGEETMLVQEEMNVYIDTQTPDLLDDGGFIWWSERDGWGHLYRYDAEGNQVARLTQGPWHVSGVVRVDEERGQVFFTANAREDGIDPYYVHLYRVNLDGSGLTQISEGNFDNRASMPQNADYVVHSFSRVDVAPQSVLRDRDGDVIMELEQADLSRMMEAGYQFPTPFQFEAADGITDIYGVMYKPMDFDSTKVYPMLQYVYPGPQTESVSKFWSTNSTEQAMANLGFIVVTLGNRGGHPDRSKWYHTYSYGNLRDYGLADKVAGINQLADRHDFIDRERIGIYGHSGGGFMSTAALLNYPEVFDVAVSSAGNHDNAIYNRWWSEKHHGVEEVIDDEGNATYEYDIDANIELAPYLQGKLLLTTGDVDNNVHPANTIRMAKALIDANKRFDFFIYPGARHGYGSMNNYWFWQRAEYFARHLLGDNRQMPDVDELNARSERR